MAEASAWSAMVNEPTGTNPHKGGSGATEVVIVSAVRTPIGRLGGALAEVRPDDMAALVIRQAVTRAGVNPADIEEVYLGCANQAGEDNRNVARMATLLAGLPESVAAVTVNRLCASGLSAVNMAARAILAGEGDVEPEEVGEFGDRVDLRLVEGF